MDDLDGTPCPVRSSTRSSANSCFVDTPPTAFPFLAHDDDDTENIEFTRALPDVLFLSKDKKKEPKGLKEPPRRFTNHIPAAKPERQEKPMGKDKRSLNEHGHADAEPEQSRRTTIYVPPVRRELQEQPEVKEKRVSMEDAQAVALPTMPLMEPERRPQGLHQQPQRSLIGIGGKQPSRRRVSAMLKAKQHVQTAIVKDEDYGRVPAPKPYTSRTSQETHIAKKPTLADKTGNTPIVKLAQKQLMAEKRMAEKKLLQPPKRAVFQAPKQQQLNFTENPVRERNTGKENIPPVIEQTFRKRERVPDKGPPKKSIRLSDEPIRMPVKTAIPPTKRAPVLSAMPAQVHKPVERIRKRNSEEVSFDEDLSFTSQGSDFSDVRGSLRFKKRVKTSIGSLPSPPGLTQEEEDELRPPSEFLLPGITSFNQQPLRKRPLDPILTEDIVRSEMYEESWLSAQESSVSQLLNRLLSEYSPLPVGKHRLILRKELLEMYTAAPFPLIYSRVHASLLYGALSITQHVLDKSSAARISRHTSNNGEQYCGWGADIGTKSKFLELFIGSYEQSVLITALEVVVGREMFAYAQAGDSEKKILEAFLERYIIKSEDVLAGAPDPVQQNKRNPKIGARGSTSGEEDRGSPAWLLRRSLLRSFMLILLLDKAKSRGTLGRQCLFKKSSAHKSSVSVLKALSQLLLPSIGDISKPLSHLNYTLETIQGPLSEYDYTIRNIAVDIRDGVRLARVVEVLLHSKRRESLSVSGEDEEEDWPLTLHLQYPAPSRTQRMHNVSLVLQALDKSNGNPQQIEAKDIVDGYREKTVGLLWSLLCQWGLGLLLDWDVVTRETRRLGRGWFADGDCEMPMDRGDHAGLLRAWARCIGAKHGLVVNNLTTSFADGKVFTAIVKEYEQYLPSYSKKDQKAPLDVKLKGLGCNSYFAGLFNSKTHNGSVFNQDFVIAGLAYLCSRLVQPSIQERAALMIQTAYRHTVFRANVHNRIRLLVLAHGCADVVRRKQAAITIQRAYRQFLHDKIQKFIQSIVGTQTLIRGVLIRRKQKEYHSAILMVQRRWRAIREARYLKRISVARQAVTGIQARIRGILARQRMAKLKQSVRFLATRWQTIRLSRKAREAYLQSRCSAMVIQKAFRQYWETKDDRQTLIQVRSCVTMVQALARGRIARLHASHDITDILAIQLWWRRVADAWRARARYTALRNATLFIQQRRRETIQARSARKDFQLLTACVSKMKNRFVAKKKTLNAVQVLQKAWRSSVMVFRMRRTVRETILIQSVMRGFLVRKTSSPRIRVIRKRLAKITQDGVKEDETLGARTMKALEQVKTKAGFARGISQLESCAKYSRECAQFVVIDELSLSAILGFIEISAVLIQKSATSITARNLLSAVSLIASIARSPSSCVILGTRAIVKGSKDVFTILLQLVETLRSAPTNTPQYELLLLSMQTLISFSGTDSIRRRLSGRKKWVEKLQTTLKEVSNSGKRRGAIEDQKKAGAVKQLLDIFG